MMTDPIADMLTRIRNASGVHKKEVIIPYSNLKLRIAEILVRAGYVEKVETTKEKLPNLRVVLKYVNAAPAIQELKRVSKPGYRHYVKKSEVHKVLNGFGLAILSTPNGLLTDQEARAAGVGGELICEVY